MKQQDVIGRQLGSQHENAKETRGLLGACYKLGMLEPDVLQYQKRFEIVCRGLKVIVLRESGCGSSYLRK